MLRRCSLETRGFWLEMLCAMYEQDVFRITGTYEELGQLASCSEAIAARSCVELKAKNVADVTLGNGSVTLLSRRLKRELTSKENTRLRVQRHRGNADVTVQSKSKSNKKEIREEHTEPSRAFSTTEEERSYLTDLLDSVKESFGLVTLAREHEWVDAGIWSHDNGFSVEQFIECIQLLKSQDWRTGPVKAEHVTNNLPNIQKLRDEKPRFRTPTEMLKTDKWANC